MFPINHHIKKSLDNRRSDGTIRNLTSRNDLIDFCSNDYLGFARSVELKEKILNYNYTEGKAITGSTGSRLLTGNSKFTEDLEAFIADYHNAEAGLIFNSGYDANIGLFSCVPLRGDTIIYDELIHASVRDGVRLSLASSFSFKHNDLSHFEDKLKLAKGNIFVAVESVYSMDGDFSPLKEIAGLCSKYNAHLIVDEAHATGVIGNGGKGRVVELDLSSKRSYDCSGEELIFARVHTFGKALGCHGAIVLGSNLLRNYLVNFSRPFIYTTALPLYSLFSIKCAYDILSESNDKILKTSNLVKLFKLKVDDILQDQSGRTKVEKIESSTPIQCIIVSGNERVKKVALQIQKSGFDVRPIMSPTVLKGKERLRICLHAFNTEEEVEALADVIKGCCICE
ncbi:MAG: pyridoxal phosphate-dependent aminotransferase family protein [Bacteroidota bacterium]